MVVNISVISDKYAKTKHFLKCIHKLKIVSKKLQEIKNLPLIQRSPFQKHQDQPISWVCHEKGKFNSSIIITSVMKVVIKLCCPIYTLKLQVIKLIKKQK